MPRYKLLIEYDGTNLVGWQRQSEGYSVQGLLEDAVQKFAHEKVLVQGAGRTDAGVHAIGQIGHVDLQKPWPPFRLREAFNAHLRPHAVAVINVENVDSNFNARFSAKYRSYAYRILNRYAPLTLERDRIWRIPQKLDISLMESAAKILLGTHDFSSFRASECQSLTPIKTLDRIEIRHHNPMIEIHVKARSFLHHQVRNMVGALVYVGKGQWTVEQFETAFKNCNRNHGAPTAPACGLYFLEVGY